MNADHRDAIASIAAVFAGAPDGDWRMTGIDVEGIDIAAGDEVARVLFPGPIAEAGGLRAALVDLARRSRER